MLDSAMKPMGAGGTCRFGARISSTDTIGPPLFRSMTPQRTPPACRRSRAKPRTKGSISCFISAESSFRDGTLKVDQGLVRTLDQESVNGREYLALRPDRTQRLDDRHQVIQGFEWITAGSRRHVSYPAIGGKRLSVIGRSAHFRISSSNASRLKEPEILAYLVHLQRLPIRSGWPKSRKIPYKLNRWCARTDYSALRASPLRGRPGGRSPSPLRGAVVEPVLSMSAVRILLIRTRRQLRAKCFLWNWCARTDSNRRHPGSKSS
jgi:hypothetical protein